MLQCSACKRLRPHADLRLADNEIVCIDCLNELAISLRKTIEVLERFEQ